MVEESTNQNLQEELSDVELSEKQAEKELPREELSSREQSQ